MANGQASIVFTGNTQQLAAALDAVGKKGKEAGDKAAKAHAGIGAEIKKAIPMVGAMSTAGGAFLAVSQKISAEWQKILQTQKEASDRLVQSSRSQARAIGLTDTPEQARQLQRLMDQLRASAGRSGQDVGAFGFTAQSRAGNLGNIEDVFAAFGALAQTEQAPDLASAADQVADVMQDFNIEAKDLQRTIGTIFSAAKASKSDFGQLASAMSEAASGGQAVGSSFEETAAILANISGGPLDVLKTQLQAMNTEAARVGFTGGSVAFAEQFRGMSAEQLNKEISNVRAVRGIAAILNVTDRIRATQGQLEGLDQAGAMALLGTSASSIMATRAGAGLSQGAAEEAQRLAQEEMYGTAAGRNELALQGAIDRRQQVGAVGSALAAGAVGGTATIFGNEAVTAGASTFGASVVTSPFAGSIGVLDLLGIIASNTAPKPPTANLGSQD